MPKKLQLQNWTKEQLVDEVARLRKRKKYGLVWEDKPEDVVEQVKIELPMLKEVKNKAITKDKNGPVNILIEGDNYHALSVLNYTHKGKIDVIYIDPPFNTGSGDFVYNDKRVDLEDAFRHSKWLSFMATRLKLAKHLLSRKGSIFVHIDTNENAQLRLLMDDIFGPNSFRNQITWLRSSSGKTISRNLADDTDYILWYSSTTNYYFSKVFKPLADKTRAMYNKDDKDGRGPYRLYPLQKTGGPGPETTYDYKDNNGKVWKCPPKGWRMRFEKLKALENDRRLFFNGKALSEKAYWNERENEGQIANNLWNDIPNIQGASREKTGFTGGQKPIALIERILKLTSDKKSVILDFFAGSGTTGHAVLALDKEDGGNRRFILCTNNENNIATEVSYPRVAKVIEGYKDAKGKKVAGINGNLKYFRTAFVGAEPNDKNKEALTKQATEMLCMREDTFEPVKETSTIKIFKNPKQHTGIVFDENAIPALKKEIVKIGGIWGVYIFSLGDDTFEDEFEDMKQKITVAPIPEAILRVYRRLFKP